MGVKAAERILVGVLAEVGTEIVTLADPTSASHKSTSLAEESVFSATISK